MQRGNRCSQLLRAIKYHFDDAQSVFQRFLTWGNFQALMQTLNRDGCKKRYEPVLYLSQLEKLYVRAKESLPQNFVKLLSLLSLSIAEHPCVVYFAFMMVELMVLDKEW